MLASIHPLGERARANRWTTTAVAYAIASVFGGAALGSALGGLAVTLPQRALVLGLMCVVAALADARSWRLPTVHRQVNEDWMVGYRGWVYGAGFGFQLGTGVSTIVTTASVYLWLAAAFLSGSWTVGVVIGATFGAARAVPVLMLHGIDSPAALRRLHHRFEGWSRRARHLTVTALALGGLALGGVASVGGGLR